MKFGIGGLAVTTSSFGLAANAATGIAQANRVQHRAVVVAQSASTPANPASDSGQMSCSQFKVALDTKIRADGDQVASPYNYREAYALDDRSEVRYENTDVVGLTLNLVCWAGDSFHSLDISVNSDDRQDRQETGLRLKRATAMAAAALCAVQDDEMKGCRNTVSQMLRKANDRFGASKKRGELSPSGVVNASFYHGVAYSDGSAKWDQQPHWEEGTSAEVSVGTDDLSFTIGPSYKEATRQ
ncbi:hypothetical protein [Labrys miyagiensis]